MNAPKPLPLLTLLAGIGLAIASCAPAAAPGALRTPVLATVPPGCFSEAFRARVERGLAGYADVADVPSVSVGVVAFGSLVYAESVGYANRTERRHASPDTPYYIASVTKPFTATLALMMVEDGVLDLDAPVSIYLPDSVRVPLDSAGGAMTLRHLLTHTAGLPKNPPNRRNLDIAGPIDPGVWDAYSVRDLYAALAATELEAALGERFAYSNYGYAVLGHIIERVAGAPFEMVLRERVLVPLGMTDTAIMLSPELEQRLAAFYWGEDPDRAERTERASFGEVAAFIGLTSTVRDLATFAAAQLQTAGETNPISFAVAARMREPYIEVDADAVFRSEMGLGWFRLSRVDGSLTVMLHTGEVDGHTSALLLLPSQGIGVVVLQNLGGDDAELGAEQVGMWLLRAASEEIAKHSGRPQRSACAAGFDP
jgi:CubicO group peptidase (beta-lactamase class C family)